jgi:glycyl-tRNA synthetase
MEALKAMPPAWLAARDGVERAIEGTQAHARVNPDGSVAVRVAGKSLLVPGTMLKVERARERVTGQFVVPHVIEPSYGVDRILYSVLEASYQPASPKREWTTLALPTAMAPIQVGVFPLMGRDNLDTTAQHVEEDLRRSGLHAAYDDSGSIGRRYARMDEVGTPFCVTVDYQTLEDGTVTLRDRDSGAQKRGDRRHLRETLERLLAGAVRFADLPWPDVAPPS